MKDPHYRTVAEYKALQALIERQRRETMPGLFLLIIAMVVLAYTCCK